MTDPVRIPTKGPPLAAELLGRCHTVSYDAAVGRNAAGPLTTVTGTLQGVGYLGREAFLRLQPEVGGEVLIRSWCVVHVEIGG